MPATSDPLAVSPQAMRGEFASLQYPLAAVAQAAYPDVSSADQAIDTLLGNAIRAAQYRIEQLSTIPFFVTRYCTQELATQKSLTLGLDFDRYVDAKSYRRDVWMRQSGATVLPKRPVKQVDIFSLTLEHGAQIIEIDLQWLNISRQHGICNVLPSGLATAGLNFQTLYGVQLWARGAATGIVPALIHVRFTAGLVERTGSFSSPSASAPYDPDTEPVNTQWDQSLVSAYKLHVRRLAAGLVIPQVAAYIERGGMQLGIDGVSESVNPQALAQRADSYQKGAEAWARETRESQVGVTVAFA